MTGLSTPFFWSESAFSDPWADASDRWVYNVATKALDWPNPLEPDAALPRGPCLMTNPSGFLLGGMGLAPLCPAGKPLAARVDPLPPGLDPLKVGPNPLALEPDPLAAEPPTPLTAGFKSPMATEPDPPLLGLRGWVPPFAGFFGETTPDSPPFMGDPTNPPEPALPVPVDPALPNPLEWARPNPLAGGPFSCRLDSLAWLSAHFSSFLRS